MIGFGLLRRVRSETIQPKNGQNVRSMLSTSSKEFCQERGRSYDDILRGSRQPDDGGSSQPAAGRHVEGTEHEELHRTLQHHVDLGKHCVKQAEQTNHSFNTYPEMLHCELPRSTDSPAERRSARPSAGRSSCG